MVLVLEIVDLVLQLVEISLPVPQLCDFLAQLLEKQVLVTVIHYALQ